jgi:ATP-dependent helicase/nuclease subunit B
MEYDRSDRSFQPTLIAPTPLAARQWETWLHAQAPPARRHVTRSLALLGYRHWLAQRWRSEPGADERPLLLSAAQRLAAWRQTVDASAERAELIDSEGPAAWAADAWERLCRYGIDFTQLRAGDDAPDLRAFLGWCDAYRSRLRDAGWIDIEGVEQRLAAQPLATTGHLQLLDLDETAPLQQRLLAGLSSAGWRIETRTAAGGPGRAVALGLADADDELRAAAAWAARRYAEAPAGRVALVIADLPARRYSVDRALEEAIGAAPARDHVWTEQGRPLDADPSIGAALTGIELLSPQGGFATFSRWLRSPFFHGTDPEALSAAARIETACRSLLLAQLPFCAAYRDAGLGARLRADTPLLASRLDTALDETGPVARRRTPVQWATRWQRALRRLGWPALRADMESAADAWEHALEDFTRLTPLLGTLPMSDAVAELRRLLEQPRAAGPMPARGVHVLGSVDAVGPGYASVWVTGLTDRHWPTPARLNPLLPRALQVAHRMPAATPADALAVCRRAMERLHRRTGDLVLSWPQRVHEQDAQPSGLLRAVPRTNAAELGVDERGPAPRPAYDPGRLEQLADTPPPVEDRRIPGGTGTLNLQARCPLRAFCQSRLGARPLEALHRGLSAKAQGIVAHRALELLSGRLSTHESLCATDAHTLDALSASCAERALAESFGAARGALRPLFELERDRFTALLRELLAAEAQRAAFEIVATERRIDARIADWTVPCRIDRVDRLADGGLAVIDYKTGRPPSAADWFCERLADTQLPLYALQQEQDVAALVVVALQRGATAYKGVWLPGQFPGRPARLPAGRDWRAQLARWRAQIEQLIAEYAAGDARLLEDGLKYAKGAYAPLSRVYEYLAREEHGARD